MKILILKCGASGDVVRTTTLLKKLKGDIYWVTKKENICFLPKTIKKIEFKKAKQFLKNKYFDLVLSLDDDFECAKLTTLIKYNILCGSYIKDDTVKYTDSCSSWFDMGIISKYGIVHANKFKKQNTQSYQEHLFNFLGINYCGEEYDINIPNVKKIKNLISIETRCGDRWPSKKWDGYHKLADLLEKENYTVQFLKQRKNIKEYINDIAQSDYLFCGDTLAMHIGIAAHVKTFSIFTCTPHQEIYNYNNLIKIYGKNVDKYLYTKKYVKAATTDIKPIEVFNIFKKRVNL